MTDVRNAGTSREVLLTTVAAATVAGLAREVLIATPTGLLVAGLVREVLVPSTRAAQQYAVTLT